MRKPAKLLYKGKRKLSKQALFHGYNSFTGLLVRKPIIPLFLLNPFMGLQRS